MTQQLKRVPIKFEFYDVTALVVPRGHRFELVDDPYITNRVACCDCGMEGWKAGESRTRIQAGHRPVHQTTELVILERSHFLALLRNALRAASAAVTCR